MTLAERLCGFIDADRQAKGSLPNRWNMNERLYNLDPAISMSTVAEGWTSYPIPLWKPKADRIIDTVFSSITQVEPYVQVFTEDDGSSEVSIEKALQAMANRNKARERTFDYAFRLAVKMAVNTNISFLYVYPDPVTFDVNFRAIHPRDMVVYPHELESVSLATSVGHAFRMTRSQIVAAFKKGDYLTDKVSSSPSGDNEWDQHASFKKTSPSSPVERKDEVITLYQLVYEVEAKRRLATVCPTTRQLLRDDPYPYRVPFYFALQFDPEYGSIWPAGSPGQEMQGLQVLFSDCMNLITMGSFQAAFPPMYAIGGFASVAAKKMQMGQILELPAGTQVGALPISFNPGVLPEAIQMISQLADAMSGITQMGTGVPMSSHHTAAETEGLLAAQQESKDAFSKAAAPCVARVFEFLFELLGKHYEDFVRHKGKIMAVPLEALGHRYTFEATGETSASSPTANMQKLQSLAQLAANPQSSLLYEAVERQIIEQLNLPLDYKSLLKPGGGAPALMIEALQQMLGAGMQPQQILQGVESMLKAAMSHATGQGTQSAPS